MQYKCKMTDSNARLLWIVVGVQFIAIAIISVILGVVMANMPNELKKEVAPTMPTDEEFAELVYVYQHFHYCFHNTINAVLESILWRSSSNHCKHPSL